MNRNNQRRRETSLEKAKRYDGYWEDIKRMVREESQEKENDRNIK